MCNAVEGLLVPTPTLPDESIRIRSVPSVCMNKSLPTPPILGEFKVPDVVLSINSISASLSVLSTRMPMLPVPALTCNGFCGLSVPIPTPVVSIRIALEPSIEKVCLEFPIWFPESAWYLKLPSVF